MLKCIEKKDRKSMKNKREGKDIKIGKDRCFIIYKEMHFSFDIYSKEHHCLERAYMFVRGLEGSVGPTSWVCCVVTQRPTLRRILYLV